MSLNFPFRNRPKPSQGLDFSFGVAEEQEIVSVQIARTLRVVLSPSANLEGFYRVEIAASIRLNLSPIAAIDYLQNVQILPTIRAAIAPSVAVEGVHRATITASLRARLIADASIDTRYRDDVRIDAVIAARVVPDSAINTNFKTSTEIDATLRISIAPTILVENLQRVQIAPLIRSRVNPDAVIDYLQNVQILPTVCASIAPTIATEYTQSVRIASAIRPRIVPAIEAGLVPSTRIAASIRLRIVPEVVAEYTQGARVDSKIRTRVTPTVTTDYLQGVRIATSLRARINASTALEYSQGIGVNSVIRPRVDPALEIATEYRFAVLIDQSIAISVISAASIEESLIQFRNQVAAFACSASRFHTSFKAVGTDRGRHIQSRVSAVDAGMAHAPPRLSPVAASMRHQASTALATAEFMRRIDASTANASASSRHLESRLKLAVARLAKASPEVAAAAMRLAYARSEAARSRGAYLHRDPLTCALDAIQAYAPSFLIYASSKSTRSRNWRYRHSGFVDARFRFEPMPGWRERSPDPPILPPQVQPEYLVQIARPIEDGYGGNVGFSDESWGNQILIQTQVILQTYPDGVPIEISGLQMSWDDGGHAASLDATLVDPDDDLIDRLTPGDTQNPPEVEVILNGHRESFLIEEISFSDSQIREASIKGRSPSILLCDKYWPDFSYVQPNVAMSAKAIMEANLPTGWTISDLNVQDWDIPGRRFRTSGQHIIGLLRRFYVPIGFFPQSNGRRSLTARASCPAPIWQWQTLTPEYNLTQDIAFSESVTFVKGASYNRIYTFNSGIQRGWAWTVAGTAGDIGYAAPGVGVITTTDVSRMYAYTQHAKYANKLVSELSTTVWPLGSEGYPGILKPGTFVQLPSLRRGVVVACRVAASVDGQGARSISQSLTVETAAS